MEKNILTISFWILFLGGLFGVVVGMISYFSPGTSPAQYGVMGIGGGAFLVWSAVVALIKSKL